MRGAYEMPWQKVDPGPASRQQTSQNTKNWQFFTTPCSLNEPMHSSSPYPARCRPHSLRNGFTLIEVMFSVGIFGIISVVFFSVVAWQMNTYYGRLAEIDTNLAAQTIINMVQVTANQAGFGFGHDVAASGRVGVGQCLAQTGDNSYMMPSSKCDRLDNGGTSDRLRVAYVDPWLLFISHSGAPSRGPCPGGSGVDPGELHITPDAITSYSAGNRSFRGDKFNMFAGGRCVGGGAGTTMLSLVGNSPNTGDGCAERRVYETFDPGGPPPLACANGFEPGWTMGLAQVNDFYTTFDSTSNSMQLMVRQQAWAPDPSPLAQGVTRFEVRYGIDTSPVPDGRIDPCPTCAEDPMGSAMGGPYSWCRDLRGPDQGGPCNFMGSNGQPMSTSELYNRVVALNVRFDLTHKARPGGYMGHVATGSTQETKTYQTTVRLRNMQP